MKKIAVFFRNISQVGVGLSDDRYLTDRVATFYGVVGLERGCEYIHVMNAEGRSIGTIGLDVEIQERWVNV